MAGAKVKVRSTTYAAAKELVKGEWGELLGVTFITASLTTEIALPKHPVIGQTITRYSTQSGDSELLTWDGDQWLVIGSPKIQVQVPASYWGSGRKKARVTSKTPGWKVESIADAGLNRGIRGNTRAYWAIDELGLFKHDEKDFWKYDPSPEAEERTRKFCAAIGMSPSFFDSDCYASSASAYTSFNKHIEEVRRDYDAVVEDYAHRLSNLLIHGGPMILQPKMGTALLSSL